LATSRKSPLISKGLRALSARVSTQPTRAKQPDNKSSANLNSDKAKGFAAAALLRGLDHGQSALADNRDKKLGLQTALKLEKDFLRSGWSPGEIFGMQLDLQRRYNVGRWALREAIGILEMRGSAFMRRGRRGGLTIARPQFENVLRACALFLTVHGCTRFHLNEAQQIVTLVASRLISRGNSDIDRETLAEADAAAATSDPLISLTQLTQNPAIEFIARIISALQNGASEPQQGKNSPSASNEQPVSIDELSILRTLVEPETTAVTGTCKRLDLQEWMRPGPSLNRYRYAMQLAFKIINDVVSRSNDDNAYLGSESEIAVKYNYSCETVRQASRILEDLGLIECRLGRNGGLITRKPRSTDVPPQTIACLIHLHVRPTSATQVLALLNEEILARNEKVSASNPVLTLLVSILNAYLDWIESDDAKFISAGNSHNCESTARLVEELFTCA
jgi:DNA-binding FadR family transcriptional regulator